MSDMTRRSFFGGLMAALAGAWAIIMGHSEKRLMDLIDSDEQIDFASGNNQRYLNGYGVTMGGFCYSGMASAEWHRPIEIPWRLKIEKERAL